MALWTEQTEHVSSYVDIKHIIIYIYIAITSGTKNET